jgi:hypothetical protein
VQLLHAASHSSEPVKYSPTVQSGCKRHAVLKCDAADWYSPTLHATQVRSAVCESTKYVPAPHGGCAAQSLASPLISGVNVLGGHGVQTRESLAPACNALAVDASYSPGAQSLANLQKSPGTTFASTTTPSTSEIILSHSVLTLDVSCARMTLISGSLNVQLELVAIFSNAATSSAASL